MIAAETPAAAYAVISPRFERTWKLGAAAPLPDLLSKFDSLLVRDRGRDPLASVVGFTLLVELRAAQFRKGIKWAF